MKINISKKEYGLLMDMLCIADWIMHAHALKEEDRFSEHEIFFKRMMAFSKEMGAEDKILFEEDLNDYYQTRDYEAYILDQFIEPYDDECFWEELIDRLAQRDLVNAIGEDKFLKMEFLERATRLEEIKALYDHEFSEHGLQNMYMKKKGSSA